MSKFGGYEDQSFIAELYDFIPGYAKRPDLGFYLEFSRSAGGKILELGCGTGRILIPTAVAGCRIVGLDISEYMLARCLAKLQRQPKEVAERARVIQGNMTNFELNETFSLITTPFRTFQHLISVSDQLACLRRANRHLTMGGKLILDLFQTNPRRMFDPVYTKESEDFPEVELPDGRKFRRTHRVVAFHRAEQYNDIEMNYYVTYPDGRTERLVQFFPFRYFFRYEVEHLLARCGFRVAELFGDFDKSPLVDASPEMIFVAEKCENIVDV
ncbi:MAG: class I SAM-dependent methyltransferase [Candidatus Poribacteria bacterium]